MRGHTATILAVKYSKDGKFIVSCAEDHTIKIWDAFTHEEVKTLRGHTSEVTAIDFLGNENEFIVSGKLQFHVGKNLLFDFNVCDTFC